MPNDRSGREVDVILVGGGTAGALLARRLVERVDATILVVEAGPPFPRWALGVPLASHRLKRPWSWKYESVPQESLEGRRIRYPMGRTLGGSSSVNAMIAAQGPAADYDAWAAGGCDGWSWDEIAPCWRRATDRGRAGGVSIEPPSFTSPFTRALVEACVETGLSRVDALTGERSGTCGRFMLFHRDRMRYSAAFALEAASHEERLSVETRRPVRRILIEGGRAVGVEFGDSRPESSVRARRGVVVCAGVFGTPAILMRSGLGPASRIRAAGIEVRVDLPGVGENLQDHVGVPVLCASNAPSPGRRSLWIPAALRYLASRSGVMASNGCEGGAFLGAEGQPPDLEIAAMFQSRHRERAVEIAAIVMHPESRGTVTIDPARPFGPPVIDPRFLSATVDATRLEEGVERVRAIAMQPSLRSFGLTGEIRPGAGDVTAHVRRFASTHYHPVGTCRMGHDAEAVVSPSLAVHGVRGLWICDNSIVPRLPAGHSAATAIIIGERGADLIAPQLAS